MSATEKSFGVPVAPIAVDWRLPGVTAPERVKLLRDAKKRNRILFDKLHLPIAS
jgi:hypothetical protein